MAKSPIKGISGLSDDMTDEEQQAFWDQQFKDSAAKMQDELNKAKIMTPYGPGSKDKLNRTDHVNKGYKAFHKGGIV